MNLRTLVAALAAAAMIFCSCASIPSLNEAPEHSSYVDERKTEGFVEQVRVFILHRARGSASDDLHEFIIERRVDSSGVPSFSIVLRYTGTVREGLASLSLSVDGRELSLGETRIERGYSGRKISERLSSAIPGPAASAIAAGEKLVLSYVSDYRVPPYELPVPAYDALKAFMRD